MRRAAFLIPLLAASACSQPFEGRVATRLTEAGLSRPMAECMADRWVDRLDLVQLKKISNLADDLSRERGGGKLSIGAFLERVRAVNDREIFEVVSSSTAVCALTA